LGEEDQGGVVLKVKKKKPVAAADGGAKKRSADVREMMVGSLPMVVMPIDTPQDDPLNPNVMEPGIYEKEKASIEKYGLIDPIAVRRLEDGSWMIVDGHHRRRACRELGHTEVACVNLSAMSTQDAHKFMLIANELRGKPEPMKLATLLTDLVKAEDLTELAVVLPMSIPEMESLIRSVTPFEWEPTPLIAASDDGSSDDSASERSSSGLGQERVFQVGQVKAHIPVKLHDEFKAEWDKSAAALGTKNAEIVLRNIVDRLRMLPPPAKVVAETEEGS
jgi:hypothetical protein